MYAVVATFRVTAPTSVPSAEVITSAVRRVQLHAAQIEHVTVVRRRDEVVAVFFLTADGVVAAQEAGRQAAAAAEKCSDALRTVSVRLRRPEDGPHTP